MDNDTQNIIPIRPSVGTKILEWQKFLQEVHIVHTKAEEWPFDHPSTEIAAECQRRLTLALEHLSTFIATDPVDG